MAQTSDRLTDIAHRYWKVTPDTLLALTCNDAARQRMAVDLRAMAASLIRQDETRGLRGLVRKVLGR
jgi:hypothetical protein